MAFLLYSVFFCASFVSSGLSAPSNNATEQSMESVKINFSNDSVVSEIHHTICSVRTEDIVAKAQTTASRILTGICTSDEMARLFKSVENKIFEKLDQIHRSLNQIVSPRFNGKTQKFNVYDKFT